MGTSKLPIVGVRAVIENAGPFQKAMDAVSARLQQFQKQVKSTASSGSPLSKLMDKIGFSADGLRDKLVGMTGASGSTAQGLTMLLGALGPIGIALAAAAAAAAAAVAAFIALGSRGANFTGLAASFDALTGSVGILSHTMLTDLRKAAAGTVSDFELIRQTNFALVGATGEFGREFGQKLPRLLEVARAQARATGQDVNYLFQSIVLGLKRSSPLILDNLGFVIKLEDANRQYAESIGKTVAELTQQEKQVALLNAVLEAGQTSLDQAAGMQETAAEKMSRAGATVTNILDKLALAAQPAFEKLLDVINSVLTVIDQAVTTLGPIFTEMFNLIAQPLIDAGKAIFDFIQPIGVIIQNVAPFVVAAFQLIGEGLQVLTGLFSGAGDEIRDKTISPILAAAKFFSDPALRNAFFRGAARTIGAFASGIIETANRVVFPAVISIATFIADFLSGMSPPPKGPLSTIDKGGANLMTAWLDGIMGVSLDPVKKVAAEVAAALGDIGKMGVAAVEKRLAQLDRTLQPFQDRLAIVKSQFEAIQQPAEAALNAIDRQMEKAVKALVAGDEQAAMTVRALDAQRAAIEGALAGQQELADAAQLQLSLAQAQQASERTLLEIRKRMLGPVEEVAKKVKEATGGTKPKEAPAGAGAATLPEAGGGMPGFGDTTSVTDMLGGLLDIDEAREALFSGFNEGFDQGGFKLFEANFGELQTQLGRISEGAANFDLGEKIASGLSGIRESIDEAIQEGFAGLSTFLTGKGEGTLSGWVDSAVGWIAELPGRFVTAVSELWTTLSESEPIAALRNFFAGESQDATTISGLLFMGASLFTGLPTLIIEALPGLWETLSTGTGPFAGIITFFTGEGDDTLQGILASGVVFFQNLPGEIVTALQGVGQAVWDLVAIPIIEALNAVISTAEKMLDALLNAAANVIDQFADVFNFVISLTPNLGIPDAHSLAAELRDVDIDLGKIIVDTPSFLTGAAAGGMFGPGMMQVGERGREVIANASSRLAVFPNNFVTAIDALTSVMGQVVAQPMPMPISAGGGNSYNDNHSMGDINMYGVQGGNDGYRRFARMRAMKRQ